MTDQKPTEPAQRKQGESLRDYHKRLGFTEDTQDDSIAVTFIGPKGVAAKPSKTKRRSRT